MPYDEKVNIANKLHKQFVHPRSERLIKFVKDASETDNEFINSIRSVESSCNIYQRYKEPALVDFSLAKDFSETIAMDFKPFRRMHFFTLSIMLLNIVKLISSLEREKTL